MAFSYASLCRTDHIRHRFSQQKAINFTDIPGRPGQNGQRLLRIRIHFSLENTPKELQKNST